MPTPITETDVVKWSREPADENLQHVLAAVNAFVAGLPAAARLGNDDALPADMELGAIMLAARLARRRNSVTGIEAATDVGVTYTARYDSDISRLLRIDGKTAPAIG